MHLQSKNNKVQRKRYLKSPFLAIYTQNKRIYLLHFWYFVMLGALQVKFLVIYCEIKMVSNLICKSKKYKKNLS